MRRVAIVGGGLSGLAAAYECSRSADACFTLFEASGRLGGVVETVRRDGFVIECGPDSWVTQKPWARELAVELGLEDEIIPSNDHLRRTLIERDGELIPMPNGMKMMVPSDLTAIEDSPLFSATARATYQREPERAAELKAAALQDGEDESVASFVRRHFGNEAVRTIAGPLLAGIFGGDIESLSVRAVLPAFVKMEREYGSLIRALQSRTNTGTKPAAIFTTLRSGLETLVERLAAALPAASIRTNTKATAITRQQNHWSIRTENAGDATTEQLFDAVILTTPAHVTRKLLAPLNPRFDFLLNMQASSAIIAAFAFQPEQARALQIPTGFGYLIPPKSGETNQLLACTFVHQKFPHRAPEGGALLRAFFGSNAAESLLDTSDETIAALALKRLSEALGPLPAPHFTVVRRWPLSLPQYAVGHLPRIAELEALAQTFPGLYLAGNAYHGIGVPDAIRTGREAARHAEPETQGVYSAGLS